MPNRNFKVESETITIHCNCLDEFGHSIIAEDQTITIEEMLNAIGIDRINQYIKSRL